MNNRLANWIKNIMDNYPNFSINDDRFRINICKTCGTINIVHLMNPSDKICLVIYFNKFHSFYNISLVVIENGGDCDDYLTILAPNNIFCAGVEGFLIERLDEDFAETLQILGESVYSLIEKWFNMPFEIKTVKKSS